MAMIIMTKKIVCKLLATLCVNVVNANQQGVRKLRELISFAKKIPLILFGGAICSLLLSASYAAELNITDGVIVKFGSDAQLVVRDKVISGKGVVLTSQKDDVTGIPLSTTSQTPAVGDWSGLRIEKSSANYGALTLNDLIIKYANTGLLISGWSPSLTNLQVSDSRIGLKLLGGASSSISNSSFLKNTTAMDVEASTPVIIGSQFSSNTTQAILNKTPNFIVTATGNWWGHESGPKNLSTNAQGMGDMVSDGVNFGSYLTAQPLISPSIRLAAPAPYYEQRNIQLDLSCINATEYRIAEGASFVGVPFVALNNGYVSVVYTVSQNDGSKSLTAQFRNAAGTVTSAILSGGVLIDTQAPELSIINPAAGSVISDSVTIEAIATDASGINRVEFYVDNQLLTTKTSAPYTYNWNVTSLLDGNHAIKVIAVDQANKPSEITRNVTLSRAPPTPDIEGPLLSNIKVNGTLLADGASFTSNTPITLSASDRSGISKVELLLNNTVVNTFTGSADYTSTLNLTNVANGSYTLLIRATDSINNVTNISYNINVAHAIPTAPKLLSPVTGTTTRVASLNVSGTAPAGSTVQLVLNGQPAGTPIAVVNGAFGGVVTLVSGSNTIQATSTDQYGTSVLSTSLQVNLDLTVPASPSNLTALSDVLGKIKLSWTRSTDPNAIGYNVFRSPTPFDSISEAIKVNSSLITVFAYDDLPQQDATWYYRVVSVNAAGTPSVPTNQTQASSDSTLPTALSIAYSPLGNVDTATGRVGQGRVNLIVTVSETLQSIPYLAIVPEAASPITVDLTKTSNTTYSGYFTIDASTASGVANAIFSARDLVGNRGTDITAGSTIKIDTQGPMLTSITLSPTAPIKNDTAKNIQATFTFSEPAKTNSIPQISYLLSGATRTPIVLSGLNKINATTWQTSFTLPSDAGLPTAEIFTFSSQAMDDLDNVSTKVSAFNRYQVYQNSLPPLDIPFALTAKALPGGKVQLDWQAVFEASGYQVYRQAPGEPDLQPLIRATGVSLVDQTTVDGAYKYAIASVRQSNGEESVSGLSGIVDVAVSSVAPGIPQNLALTLTGQGIYATWLAPLASTVDSYNLYRASGTTINSISGLIPYKTKIKQTSVLDVNPSPTEGAYVVTALDAAGNESAISNSAYLNASLLPVKNLKVEQLGNDLPVISWAAPNGNLSGYLVYVGKEPNITKLTPVQINATSISDSGYTTGERAYTVSAVDSNGVEMPHHIVLPNVSTQIVSGTPIQRGVMNKLQVQVVNLSSANISNARVVVRLPINKESTQFQDHKSDLISLSANETKLISVVVGGYSELPTQAQAQIGMEIVPNEGELVKISHQETLSVIDGSLVVGIATEEFTRGGNGKVKLTIENTSEVDVELLTATSNGANESTELRFKLLDADGNVLASQSYKQVFGANVITLINGMTVARIPAGSSYVSDVFNLNVPAASPDSVRVKLEVDKLRYHTAQADQITIVGRGSEKLVSLLDTAYVGEVTNVEPVNSFGDQDIIITGRAVNRQSAASMPDTRLKLILNQQGFERSFSVLTDALGNFSYVFKPTVTDSGLYKVSAVHPDITDRPEQKAFNINRVTVTPTPYKLDIPRNYPFSIPFVAKAGIGTSANNLTLAFNAASQTTGTLPTGITLQMPVPVSLSSKQSLNVPVVFTANNDAQASGSLILDVVSNDQPNAVIGKVKVDYTLSEAKPYLLPTPSFVETGLSQGGSEIESVVIENKGLQDALNLQFSLTKADGSPAPSWVGISSQPNGTLVIGEKRAVDISFTPPAGTQEAVYEFKLNVQGDNVPAQALNVYASVTQSGQGNVLFKAADIYTATLDKQGQLILGLANANVTVQNEDVATISRELVTDNLGEALFQNLPAGRYKFRVKASNHQELGGRFQIKPGITINQPVFLDYNLVTVEWSVREVTIQDRYEVTLNATFETDVPAAVVVMQPASINLPVMSAGDVYNGELTLTNYGLIRADNVKQKLPASDGYFRYEFLVDIPPTLEAKQSITIPYRIIAIQSLDTAASAATAGGAGCYNYSNSTGVSCSYVCSNGTTSSCGASSGFFSGSNSSCGSGGGSGGGGGWGGSGWGGATGTPQAVDGPPPCIKCGDGACCTK